MVVNMPGKLPVIALTMGDPAGIGPELAVKAASSGILAKFAEILVYGCPDILRVASAKFTKGKKVKCIETGSMLFKNLKIGKENSKCGLEAYNAIVTAAKDVIGGKANAIVTCPVNKASVNMAGIEFSGHTELVAELCDTADFAMMQSSRNLRVAFVTTHIPLKEVSKSITFDRIIKVGLLLHKAIKQEGIANPRIAVAGVNPHAGENGFMGCEEIKTVIPAIKRLNSDGLKIDGPFPADTLFISSTLKKYDGILAMYHDQGHIPFKMIAFDRGVNSTLGLPIVRTSVDHGTAFDIAWKGIADTGSLFAAVKLAAMRSKKA